MATKTDISYGIIPIRRVVNGWEVFLINQYSRIGDNTYWVIPKGHPEGEETPKETALRELKEETGLVPQTVVDSPMFDLKYSFDFNSDRIEKTVVFFVGVIEDSNTVLDPEEVKEGGWYALEVAVKRLDYQDTKSLFLKAKDFIEKELFV